MGIGQHASVKSLYTLRIHILIQRRARAVELERTTRTDKRMIPPVFARNVLILESLKKPPDFRIVLRTNVCVCESRVCVCSHDMGINGSDRAH